MGWLVAIIVLPLLFVVAATYIVLRLGMMVVRLMFAPALALRRR